MIIIKDRKIDAIKAVRQYCLDTFGVVSGLKVTKEFVDAVLIDQELLHLRGMMCQLRESGIGKAAITSAVDDVFGY